VCVGGQDELVSTQAGRETGESQDTLTMMIKVVGVLRYSWGEQTTTKRIERKNVGGRKEGKQHTEQGGRRVHFNDMLNRGVLTCTD
jgi:hypothetical protein